VGAALRSRPGVDPRITQNPGRFGEPAPPFPVPSEDPIPRILFHVFCVFRGQSPVWDSTRCYFFQRTASPHCDAHPGHPATPHPSVA
jgi:hypothetical protein